MHRTRLGAKKCLINKGICSKPAPQCHIQYEMGISKRIFIPLNLVLLFIYLSFFPVFLSCHWLQLHGGPAYTRHWTSVLLKAGIGSDSLCIPLSTLVCGGSCSWLVTACWWGTCSGECSQAGACQGLEVSLHIPRTHCSKHLDSWIGRLSWLICVKWCCTYTTADAGSLLKAAVQTAAGLFSSLFCYCSWNAETASMQGRQQVGTVIWTAT